MSTDVKQPVIDALENAFAKTGTEPSLKAYEALNNIDMKNIERVEESIKDIGTDKFKIEKQLLPEELLSKPTDDVDLVKEVTRVIFKTIGEDAATYFNLDGGISFANGKHSLLQRVVISRYFTNLLVRFRGYVEIEGILTTIRYIKKDGTHQQWFTALVRDVLPFILEKRIFDFFIAKDAYVLEARRQKIEELKKQQEQ